MLEELNLSSSVLTGLCILTQGKGSLPVSQRIKEIVTHKQYRFQSIFPREKPYLKLLILCYSIFICNHWAAAWFSAFKKIPDDLKIKDCY